MAIVLCCLVLAAIVMCCVTWRLRYKIVLRVVISNYSFLSGLFVFYLIDRKYQYHSKTKYESSRT